MFAFGRPLSQEFPSEAHKACHHFFKERKWTKGSAIEITTFIREDQALALEILENARRYSSGVNFDKGTLVREALDLMIEKYRTDINLIFR